MRSSRLIVAVVLALVGLLWIGQGVGLLGGGAMSGQAIWAVIGAVALVAGLLVGWREIRSDRPARSG